MRHTNDSRITGEGETAFKGPGEGDGVHDRSRISAFRDGKVSVLRRNCV